MEILEIDGKRYEIPEGMTAEQIYEEVKGISSDSTEPQGRLFPEVQPSDSWLGSIDPDALVDDPNWLKATRIMYKAKNGEDFQGEDADLAAEGLRMMGWFNYNSLSLATNTAQIINAPTEQKQAFLYMMDTYDELTPSMGGAYRFAKGAAADPLTWTGLITFGAGTAGAQVVQQGSKAAAKSIIKGALVAGLETGIQAGLEDVARQSIEISAEKEPGQEFSLGRTAMTGAVGFGLGALVGGAVRYGLNKFTADAAEEVVPTVAREAEFAMPALKPTTGAEQLDFGLERLGPHGAGMPENATQRELFGNLPEQLPTESQYRRPSTMQGQYNEEGLTNRAGNKVSVVPKQEAMELAQPSSKSYAYDGQGSLFDNLPVERRIEASAEESTITSAARKKALSEAPSPAKVVSDLHQATDGDAGNAIIKAIRDAVDETGWRMVPGGKVEVSERVQQATEILANLNVKNADEAKKVLDQAALTAPQFSGLKSAIASASDKLDKLRVDMTRQMLQTNNKLEQYQISQEIEKIAKVQDTVAKLQLASSSQSGRDLFEQQGRRIVGGRRAFASPEIIMENNPSLTRRQAEEEYVRAALDLQDQIMEQDAVKNLTTAIRQAVAKNDFKQAELMFKQRKVLIDSLGEKAGMKSGVLDKINRGLTELFIGNAFSLSTFIVNTIPSAIKSIYKPVLNSVVDNKATIRSAMSAYSAMASGNKAALNYAKAVFKLEHNPFFGKNSDFLGADPAIPGTIGRIIRFFPRLVESTDAYFSQIMYRGFVAQEAYNIAFTEGVEKLGLKGEALTKHIDEHVKRVTDNMFNSHVDSDAALDMLMKAGIDRGLTDKKLEIFIRSNLEKNSELFDRPTNVGGRTYVEDMLFRRPFSGESLPSKLAQNYEKMMNSNVLMRLAFQLFIRTPIRVFEEGFRLTPGLNVAYPQFMSDLMGKNGAIRQIRAQGEAMLSMAFGGSVLAMYSSGMITGGGPANYKQNKGKQNTREWQPYTIYLPGGTTISYRNLDPFATPLKIIVNALDSIEDYQYRAAQGEYKNNPTEAAMAMLGVAALPLIRTVKDANLTEGLNQFSELVDWMINPTENEDSIARYFSQKAKLLVPASVSKVQTLVSGEPVPMFETINPVTAIESRINPYANDIPVQRDALGFKRYVGNTTASFFGIGVDNLLADNVTPEAKEVLKELSDIEYVNDTNFVLPSKIKDIGDFDLRSRYMPDGKTTYYDHLYDIYNKSGVIDALYNALIVNKQYLTSGTASLAGTREEVARSIITDFRQAAVAKFLSEVEEARQHMMELEINKLQAKSGMYDGVLVPR